MQLTDCIQVGLAHNTSIQAAQLQEQAAGRDVKMARADFLPSLTSSFSVNRIGSIASHGLSDTDYLDQYSHSGSIRLTQILFAGLRVLNSYDKAKLLKEAYAAEADLTRLELIYKIESTFYKVMQAKYDVQASLESVHRLRENVKVAEAFFAKELIPYVDLLTARVDLADAENRLGMAQNEKNRNRMTLFSLMDLPMTSDITFIGGKEFSLQPIPLYDDCFEYAVQHRPDLKNLTLQKQAAEKSSNIALGKYTPTVRLEGGYYDVDKNYDDLGDTGTYTYDRDQRNRYWMAGVTVTWDLFDGGRAWQASEKSALEAQRFQALHQEALNTISTGIRKALYSMGEAEQRFKGAVTALNAAKENYAAENNRVAAGVSPITKLLDAQNRLVRAQVNTSNATLDYQLARTELNFMAGGNVVEQANPGITQ